MNHPLSSYSLSATVVMFYTERTQLPLCIVEGYYFFITFSLLPPYVT